MRKPWYQSKTIWANVLMVASLLLAAPEIQVLFGEHALRIVVAAQVGINIVLRLLTNKALSV